MRMISDTVLACLCQCRVVSRNFGPLVDSADMAKNESIQQIDYRDE